MLCSSRWFVRNSFRVKVADLWPLTSTLPRQHHRRLLLFCLTSLSPLCSAALWDLLRWGWRHFLHWSTEGSLQRKCVESPPESWHASPPAWIYTPSPNCQPLVSLAWSFWGCFRFSSHTQTSLCAEDKTDASMRKRLALPPARSLTHLSAFVVSMLLWNLFQIEPNDCVGAILIHPGPDFDTPCLCFRGDRVRVCLTPNVTVLFSHSKRCKLFPQNIAAQLLQWCI